MDECGIYGVIQAEDTLTGGFPKCDCPLSYEGTYDVIPKAYTMQTLATSDKYMEKENAVSNPSLSAK